MHAGGGQTGGEAEERQVKPMRDALLVIDMQNGVFATPRHARAAVVGNINRLMAAAPHTVIIRHTDDELPTGSVAWQLLPELHVPAAAVYLDKTACNAFYRTALAATLAERHCRDLTICGCTTDYCRRRCPHHRRPPAHRGGCAHRLLQRPLGTAHPAG